MTERTCRDFFCELEGRFKPEQAGSLEATFQFELLGEGGGQWHVEVSAGGCRVGEGRASNPSLTVTMAAQDFVDMINGRLSPQMAFLSGKLSISPRDLALAQTFGRLFF
jgi:putative sterol carrier protein